MSKAQNKKVSAQCNTTTFPAEYNVQELQNKISMLTDRCQSAERERKEARRERDETVKQLQEVNYKGDL